MKIKFLVPIILVAATVSVHAVNIATWTFEVNTPSDLNNSTVGPSVAADIGAGTATGLHASAASDWTTPAGNGSANSYSVNTWAVGDYFQFQVNTLGYQDIMLSWDQTSSGTGPISFKLAYSTDGLGFTDFVGGSYSVGTASWSSGSGVASNHSFDLSSIIAIENTANVYFRLINLSSVETTGTDRVDNFTVSGVSNSVPDSLPSSFAALTFVFFLSLGYRLRRQSLNA